MVSGIMLAPWVVSEISGTQWAKLTINRNLGNCYVGNGI